MSNFIRNIQNTPQTTQRYPDTQPNPAGGYSWFPDDLERLKRFIVVGTEGGNYYESEQQLDRDMYPRIIQLCKGRPEEVLDILLDIVDRRLAPKMSYALLVLAILTVENNSNPKALAKIYQAVPKVCNIPTHVFQYMDFCQKLGKGNGSGFNRAIGRWLEGLSSDTLALYAVKYRKRYNWSLQDLMRLIRPRPSNSLNEAIYGWIAKRTWNSEESVPQSIKGYNLVNNEEVTTADICKYIEEYKLPWEALPTKFLKEKSVWEALLPSMGCTAVLRNLANMTRHGVFNVENPKYWDNLKLVDEAFKASRLAKAKVHPMNILKALFTYETGKSEKGDHTWTPSSKIMEKLEKAFYDSFEGAPATNKVILTGIDASGSMDRIANGSKRPYIHFATAINLALVNTEPNTITTMFNDSHTTKQVDFRKNMTISQAFTSIPLTMSGTDLSDPVRYALEKKIKVDAFVIYTDGMDWSGPHSKSVYDEYKKKINPNVKLVVVQLVSTPINTFGNWSDTSLLNTLFTPDLPSVINAFLSI